MFHNFTRRHLLDVPEYDLKYEYIPQAFRFDLYKIVKSQCDSSVQEYCLYRDSGISVNKDTVRFPTADEINEYYNPDFFIEMLQDITWHEVLSIVEYYVHEQVINSDQINELFSYHKVGYRYEEPGSFSESGMVVVHYDSLIHDTEKLIDTNIGYEGVTESIKTAQNALVNPEEIDFAHSIKFSVDAVEGFLKGWLEEKKIKVSRLGDAIKELRKNNLCSDHIVRALEQFYIFRNRTENVGHGAPDVAPISKEDALLCLEMSISFINYFFRKDS